MDIRPEIEYYIDDQQYTQTITIVMSLLYGTRKERIENSVLFPTLARTILSHPSRRRGCHSIRHLPHQL